MFTRLPYMHWIALLLALLIWGAVAFLGLTISSAEAARIARDSATEQALMAQAAALHTRAVLRETEDLRTELENIAEADGIEILDAIETASRDSGIQMNIGEPSTAGKGNRGSPLNAATFVVDMEGTFANLAKAIAFLESMPIPSTIEELNLERVEGSEKSIWKATVRLRFLTTADITS